MELCLREVTQQKAKVERRKRCKTPRGAAAGPTRDTACPAIARVPFRSAAVYRRPARWLISALRPASVSVGPAKASTVWCVHGM